MLYRYELLGPTGQRIQDGQFTDEDLPNAPGYDPAATDEVNAQSYADWTVGDQVHLDDATRTQLRAVVHAGPA